MSLLNISWFGAVTAYFSKFKVFYSISASCVVGVIGLRCGSARPQYIGVSLIRLATVLVFFGVLCLVGAFGCALLNNFFGRLLAFVVASFVVELFGAGIETAYLARGL